MGLIGGAAFLAFMVGVVVWAIRRGNEQARKALWMFLPFVLVVPTCAVFEVEEAQTRRSLQPITSTEELEAVESHERVLVQGRLVGPALAVASAEGEEWVWVSGGPNPSELEVELSGGSVSAWQPRIEAADRYGFDRIGLKRRAGVLVVGRLWKADAQIGEATLYGPNLSEYRSELFWFELVPPAIAACLSIPTLVLWAFGFWRPKSKRA